MKTSFIHDDSQFQRLTLTKEDKKRQEQMILCHTNVYISERDSIKYANLSNKQIAEEIKKNYAPNILALLRHTIDLTAKHLNSIYRKYRKEVSLPDSWAYKDKKSREYERISVLSHLASHRAISQKLLKKLTQEKHPAVRLAATLNPELPENKRQEIYIDLVNNDADGNRCVLLKTVFASDLPVELGNKALQNLFNNGEYGELDGWGKTIRKFSNEVFEAPALGKTDMEELEFSNALQEIRVLEDLTMETMKAILDSGHTQAISALCENKYLDPEMYEYLANFHGFLNLEEKPEKYPDYNLHLFAGNPGVPGWMLKSMVEKIIPSLSYKQRGAAYNHTSVAIAKNPETPLDALLTLRSLHNDVEYQKYCATGQYNNRAEILGNPLELRQAVDAHPKYLHWVENTPNYKELLPAFIPCPCHGL